MGTQISDDMRKLEVSLYGEMENLSETLSKCRVRIFYRGLNRNRTYISEDFSNQLIQSLPYAPIKGIFNYNDVDFEDHGLENTDGRIYGVVAANPNYAWERHLDIDGVEREYVCADVILYTSLYPEAKLIAGKSQSMEIHQKGLSGEWKTCETDNLPYFEFHTGHLIGLQVLGDEIEPCFEGAAFFSLYKEAKELYDYIKNSNKEKKEDDAKMGMNNFKLPEDSVYTYLWDSLNNTENDCISVQSVYEDYALAYDYNEEKYIRAYYTKDETSNEYSIDKIEQCYVLDLDESEQNEFQLMKELGSYSEIQEKLNAISDAAASKDVEEVLEQEVESTEFENDTQDSETETNTIFETQLSEKNDEIFRLNKELTDIKDEMVELKEFKLKADKESKKAILKEFSTHLTESQVQSYSEQMDNYSVIDFKKEVCVAAYETDTSLFNKTDDEVNLIYKNSESKEKESGVIKLLNKYKGGNN